MTNSHLERKDARPCLLVYNKAGDFMTEGKWFLVGSIGVAAVLFGVAVVLKSGVAAVIAFVPLLVALFGRHFV